MPNIQDIEQIKWCNSSGVKRDVKEIVYRGEVIWPAQPVITIGDVYAVFSTGSLLYANASNYVILRATLRTRQGDQTVTLIPDSMPSDYFENINGRISTNKISHGTELYSNISGSLTGYYLTQDGTVVRPSFGDTSVTVALEDNTIVSRERVNDSYTMTIYNPNFDAKGGHREPSGTVYFHNSCKLKSDYYVELEYNSEPQKPTSVTCQGATISGIIITIPINQHNTSSKKFYAYGIYSGLKSTPVTISQEGDYEYEGVVTTDWYAEISKTYDNVWAGGGSGTISYSAYHIIHTPYYWYSDDAYIRRDDERVNDTALISGTGTRFSRSGSNVTHQNMTTNVGTDSVTYTCTNNSHTSTKNSVTFFAVNSKGAGTTSTEYGTKSYGTTILHKTNYTVSLSSSAYSSSSSPCPAKGGSCTLTFSGSHKEQEEKPYSRPAYEYLSGTYTSGSPYKDLQRTYTDTGSDWGTQTTKTDTITPSITGTGFSLSGRTVSITSEGTTPYNSGRTATVSVENDTASRSITLYQQYNRIEQTTYGAWKTPQYIRTDTNDKDFTVSISAGSFTEAPFWRATYDILTLSASHTQVTTKRYLQYRDVYNTWTSTEPETIIDGDVQPLEESTSETVADTPTIKTSPTTGILISGTEVTFYENSGALRRFTITASNRSATPAQITLSQKAYNLKDAISFVGIGNVVYMRNLYGYALTVNATVTTYTTTGQVIATVTKTMVAATSGTGGVAKDTNWQLGYQPGGSFVSTINSVTR